jgi:hypothetical protein
MLLLSPVESSWQRSVINYNNLRALRFLAAVRDLINVILPQTPQITRMIIGVEDKLSLYFCN